MNGEQIQGILFILGKEADWNTTNRLTSDDMMRIVLFVSSQKAKENPNLA